MFRFSLLLAFLASTGHARRVQNPVVNIAPSEKEEGSTATVSTDMPAHAASEGSLVDMVKALGTSLLTLGPSSLFSPRSMLHSQAPRATSSRPDIPISRTSSEIVESTEWGLGPVHPYIHRAMPRTGALSMSLPSVPALSSPSQLFNVLLCGLAGTAAVWRFLGARGGDNANSAEAKPSAVKSLQFRFLIVFWLIRMADWLQGPYFYEVYSSKVFNGVQASLGLVSKIFLVGFLSTGVFGPFIGKFVDSVGRKAGTLAFTALYSLGALSTRSSLLNVLLLGRVAGGIGTSLLFSAPEAWFVGEHQRNGFDGKWLGQTFGLAYAGDALVAILAGQLAGASASKLGPSGPFTLSVAFLAAGALLTLFKWKENTAASVAAATSNENQDSQKEQEPVQAEANPTVADACRTMFRDKRILLLGAVQALFEGAMYIFVLQWPPAMTAAIEAASGFASGGTPYGVIFSCFMTCCLLGSTAFGTLQSKNVSVEKSTSFMLLIATLAMSAATYIGTSSLAVLIAAFFVFEGCVGMYFPSIGTLRSRYLPDRQRSVLINLFGIPLNLIVITVFLLIGKLGVSGALFCSSSALGLATLCMSMLERKSKAVTA